MNKMITMITGTSQGIGNELAKHFLKSGHIVIGCSRTKYKFDSENYHHFTTDLADHQAIQNMFKQIREKWSSIDHLINNAGSGGMNHLMLTSYEKALELLKINFLATFLCTQEAARLMMTKKSGKIINFTSVAVPLLLEGESVYAASKAAVETFTRISAKEIQPWNITVNAIGFGPVKTRMTQNIASEKIQELFSKTGQKDFLHPQQIVKAVEKLIQDDSRITGQVEYLYS